eukprot:CAMPEP_0119146694 /NCGR_PEP_ID=MMETSP1310-20130426/39280_1 /TAXON_ID=464262 /ORGANISM="Genus nov. species nov., Strain RCC2339" /LENGTH=451 /DNA_ID=CAMNT_0007138609 /DNA_START=49 /DNA_END=1401 /DNA_ORIENTATION=-
MKYDEFVKEVRKRTLCDRPDGDLRRVVPTKELVLLYLRLVTLLSGSLVSFFFNAFRPVVVTMALVTGLLYLLVPSGVTLYCFAGAMAAYAVSILVLVRPAPHAVKPGFYFQPTPRNERAIGALRALGYRATWWLPGDLTTLVPFLCANVLPVEYERRWMQTEDGEFVALDYVGPSDGGEVRGVCLALHGLNGGSAEPYLLDFVHRARERGYAVVVLIARGMMGTPVIRGEFFNGARTTDVRMVLAMLREVVPRGRGIPLVGVGYSMGATVLANYMAKSGDLTELDAGVAMCGVADANLNSCPYSRLVWQPLLSTPLKTDILYPFQKVARGRGVDVPKTLYESRSIVAFDTHMTAPYFGYNNLEHYYSDMSFCDANKWKGVRSPLLFVQTLDDPLVSGGSIEPYLKVADENENILFCVLERGGHVGFPHSNTPWRDNFQAQSEIMLRALEAF